VQLRYLGFPAELRFGSLVVERLGQVLDGLPFPLGDLVRVKCNRPVVTACRPSS